MFATIAAWMHRGNPCSGEQVAIRFRIDRWYTPIKGAIHLEVVEFTCSEKETSFVMRSLSESTIIRDVAKSVFRRITRRVIRSLQGMTEPRLSGDDSVLRNVWDEVCVQVQFEDSIYWDAYEHTVTSLVAGEFDRLVPFEREAVWLLSPQGVDWSYEEKAARTVSSDRLRSDRSHRPRVRVRRGGAVVQFADKGVPGPLLLVGLTKQGGAIRVGSLPSQTLR